MNSIIVDSDCKLYFPEEHLVKKLLKGSECKVYYLDYTEHLKLEPNCRCVLLSTMNSGIKKYHMDLIRANSGVRTWIISIVGTFFESEKKQLLDNIDTTLSCCKITYSVLFDDHLTLEKTSAVCLLPMRKNKMCLVSSLNSDISNKCANILASYLSKWDIICSKQDFEQLYQSADIILFVGEKKEDFFLPAPKYRKSIAYAWIMCSEKNAMQLQQMVYEELTERGWNLGSAESVYVSTLQFEEYLQKINSGKLSYLELNNDVNFAVWDEYGLPLKIRDYSKDTILSFLNRQCCFKDLVKRFE